MKTEFIYSVGEIFGEVLREASLKDYYIGPYQRGYKWKSKSFYDEVPRLLIDVYEAFKNDIGEYYLQYITVVRNSMRCSYEVIDGQQRLTTLAIIYERLRFITEGKIQSIAFGKIVYARDEENTTLYDKIAGKDSNGNNLEDTQDLYYINNAVKCIDIFLNRLKESGELYKYVEFMTDKVKIILNRESDFVSAEEVFSNLNGNRVELTNAYLIKGLLLTKGVQKTDKRGLSLSYINIIEQRRINGRIWDEIQNWIEQREVCYYFFGKAAADGKTGMEELLHLLLDYGIYNGSTLKDESSKLFLDGFKNELEQGNDEKGGHMGFHLFNRYNELIKTDSAGLECMRHLIHLYRKLRTIYDNPELFNLLGYVLFMRKHEPSCDLIEIIDEGEEKIKSILSAKVLDILPDVQEKELRYNDRRLTPFLLAFSVFPETTQVNFRFDFVTFDSKKWTYEHIRPRNPKTEGLVIPSYCKMTVRELLDRYEKTQRLEEIKSALESKEISVDEFNKIFDSERLLTENMLRRTQIDNGVIEDIEDFPFLYSDLDDQHLHSMGNMALLSDSVNSSVSNNPFIIKRGAIMRKAETGSFIPSHTLRVFAKSINLTNLSETHQFSSDMFLWDASDVDAHAEWMRVRNREIRSMLNKKVKQ